MKSVGRSSRFRPSYIWAGLRATGTAADLRRLFAMALRLRSRLSRMGTPHNPPRVLAHVPNYPPHAYGGAESSIQAIMEYLSERGYDTRVTTDESPPSRYTHNSIRIHARPSRAELKQIYESCDVVLTQKSSSTRSQLLATRYRKPVAVFVRDIGEWRRLPARPDLLVFNANWQRDMFGYEGNSIVLYPPIDPGRYRTTPGSRVSLVNLNERKGGRLFLEIVTRMPDVEFLAVTGVWGDTLMPSPVPENLKLVGPTDDMREVYSQTRVLLLPSRWESFGRVAVEAGLSGIPVIASPNPGTFEALHTGAIYARPSVPDEWIRAIRGLQNQREYERASLAVIEAANRVVDHGGLDELEAELARLISGRRDKRVPASA